MVVVLRRRVLHHHRSDFPRSFAERERETERETREEEYSPVPSSSARSLTLSFFLLLSDFTKNIIFFLYLSSFDFFLFLD